MARSPCPRFFTLRVNATACKTVREPALVERSGSGSRALDDLGNFIEMRIDLIGQIVELAPGLAEVRRFVSRLRQFAILPLELIDDAPTIDASVQADRDTTRLTRHEMRALRHQR